MANPFQRTATGYAISLEPTIRDLLGHVLEELRDALLMGDRDSLRRLYPPAYADDEARQADYDALVRDDLLARRLDAIDTVEATVDAGEVTGAELEAWVGVINDVRLVLGTRLDVSEEQRGVPADHPDAFAHDVYDLLSQLLGLAVDALTDDG